MNQGYPFPNSLEGPDLINPDEIPLNNRPWMPEATMITLLIGAVNTCLGSNAQGSAELSSGGTVSSSDKLDGKSRAETCGG